MFLTRVRTGFLLLFVGCLFLSLSHIPAVLLLGMSALAALAMAELAEPLGMKKPVMALGGGALCLLVSHADQLLLIICLGVLFLAYLVVCWLMMTALPHKKEFRIPEVILLILAVPVFVGTACQLRQREAGLYTLMLPVLVCAATDTFAYFVGRRLGKRSLAPHISPKKTLEGALGGGVLALVLLVAVGIGLQWLGLAQVRMELLCLYTLTASAVGQFGDLCLSAVKRVAGIKDFGDVLPGHGGILDRMDSCMLALPYTYLFIACFGSIFK